jgi:hypothetical protein
MGIVPHWTREIAPRKDMLGPNAEFRIATILNAEGDNARAHRGRDKSP